MSRDKEALAFIADLATKAGKAHCFQPPHEPDGVYLIFKPDGTHERVETPPPREERLFFNVDHLAEWGHGQMSPTAWVSLSEIRVTAVNPRQNYGVLPIGESPQLGDLKKLDASVTWTDQAGLVRFLRTNMAGCVPQELVGKFRNVRWMKNESGAGNLQHTGSNLGKSLEAAVTGVDVLPESFEVSIPMTKDPLLGLGRQRVVVIVDIDHVQNRFALIPVPGDVARAVRAAEIELCERMADAIMRNRPGLAPNAIEDDEKRKETQAEVFPVYAGRASVK